MSSDADMFSDDLVPNSDLIGHDTRAQINGNSHANGAGDQDTSMSEDEDADMPLVCSNLLNVTHQTLIEYHSIAGTCVQVGAHDPHCPIRKAQKTCLRRIVQ